MINAEVLTYHYNLVNVSIPNLYHFKSKKSKK